MAKATGFLGGLAALIAAVTGILPYFTKDKSDATAASQASVQPSPPAVPPAQAAPAPPPVEFTLYDQLGPGDVSEYLAVHVDGKPVGHLTLNQGTPNGALRLHVAKAGLHRYTVEGILTHSRYGYLQRQKLSGKGALDVTPGKTFEPVVVLNASEPASARIELKESMPGADGESAKEEETAQAGSEP